MAGARQKALPRSGLTLTTVTEAIVAQTSLGIWVLDAGDRTVWANDRLTDMLGVDWDTLEGASVYDFIDQREAESTRAALRRRRTGTTEMREATIHAADGRVIDVFAESIPLVADGEYL